MRWSTLEILEVAALASVALVTHAIMRRFRRPFIAALEGLAGPPVRGLAAVSDVVSGLLYLGFGAAAVPLDGTGRVTSYQIESAFDTVALFAVLVATVQVVNLLALHRAASHLESWPPTSAEAVTQ